MIYTILSFYYLIPLELVLLLVYSNEKFIFSIKKKNDKIKYIFLKLI